MRVNWESIYRLPLSSWKLLVALGLTTAQLALALLAVGGSDELNEGIRRYPPSFSTNARAIAYGISRYEKLCGWDCFWYWHIAENGYRSTVPPTRLTPDRANVAFFPGFPLAARALHRLSGSSWPTSVLLGSQLAAVGFWWYVLALLERNAPRPWVRVFAVFAILAHPSSLYLVAGYSESLFMMSLLGFIFWSERSRGELGERRSARVLTAVHGFIMTATRIVGIPVAVYPAVRSTMSALSTRRMPTRSLAADILVSLAALAGGLGFLLFCQLKFGHWDLLLQTQRVGWGARADYLAPFQLSTYRGSNGNYKAVTATTLAALALFAAEALLLSRSPTEEGDRWRRRFAGHFVAISLLYVTIAGGAGFHFLSFARYSLPISTILVFIAVDQWSLVRLTRPKEQMVAVVLGLALSASLIRWTYVSMAIKHFHWQWFA